MTDLLNRSVAFFPLLAAVLYGLNYALYGHLFKQVPLFTFLVISSAANLILFLVVGHFRGEVSLAQFSALTSTHWLWIGINMAIGIATWLMLQVTMQKISPTYLATGEIAYVLFVPLFSWLLFKEQTLDRYTVIAGFLILAGSAVMIYGKSVTPSKTLEPVLAVEATNARL